MKDLKIGDRVIVVIDEPVDDVCVAINFCPGTVVGKDDWMFPYTVEMDNPQLNKMGNEDYPRRFTARELILQ